MSYVIYFSRNMSARRRDFRKTFAVRFRFIHDVLACKSSRVISSNTVGRYVELYFRSGWAFLVPYFFSYLVYAWLGWPANLNQAASLAHPVFRFFTLLKVFWGLHIIHFILAVYAFVSLWRRTLKCPKAILIGLDNLPISFGIVMPWALLALYFWIPGVYLEFPSDPWEHYARINEWSRYVSVTDNPVWTKFSYFFAYSFLGRISTPLLQLKYFDVYYTGCCLLLCWQYYRLSQAVGLGKRAAFVFSLIQVLSFGNNIFGFYRYYGMSSTLFAQIGAIVFLRVALEALPTHSEKMADKILAGGSRKSIRHWLLFASTSLILLALTGFNHIQGLGVAALGLGAISIWRLVAWRRAMAAWIALGAVVLSLATVLWLPRSEVIDAYFRPAGWLTSWYGFNLLLSTSPAFDRAWTILGALGALNLGAGLILLCRNHVVGWLTILPLLALCSPIVAIPFANAISQNEPWYILTFHRFLFAIPAGLALVVAFDQLFDRFMKNERFVFRNSTSYQRSSLLYCGLCAAVVTLLLFPVHGPIFNRFWHSIVIPPNDLAMRHILANPRPEQHVPIQSQSHPVPYAIAGIGFVGKAAGGPVGMDQYRLINLPVIPYTVNLIDAIKDAARKGTKASLFLPDSNVLYSCYSQSAILSHHWLPFEVAMEHAGDFELRIEMGKLHWKETRGVRASFFQPETPPTNAP